MVISKTPLRISFFGGGTDYPDYISKHGGAVLSTSINKYVYVTLDKINPLSEFKYKLAYSKLESPNTIEGILHPSAKACLKYMDVSEGMEIHIMNDLPAKTGLGSSSSFTVGLLNTLYKYKSKKISALDLAKKAIYVEQKIIGEKVGVQDQCAAAVGGLNYFEFKKNGSILVNPVSISAKRKKDLNDNLLLFYTGIQRFSEDILTEQINKTRKGDSKRDLSTIRQMVDEGYKILTSNKNLNAFGDLLHQAWLSKKMLSSAISNTNLDNMYSTAMKAGAIGGKLLGAGGGGFFLFYIDQKNHTKVRTALKKYQEIDFDFDTTGSQIIHF